MKKLLLIKLIFWITLGGISPQNIDKNRIEYLCERQYFLDNVYDMPFSVDNLRRALEYSGIQHAEIVFFQAILETGNFTSEIFLRGQNLFGLKPARKRETTNIGEFNYHSIYKHWFDSILDLKLLQEYWNNKGYDINDYYVFLQSIRYATDPLYIQKLQNLNII